MGSVERPILVTGAGGFIGANICRHFVERGRQVIGLEGPQRLSWRIPESPRLALVQVDVRIGEAVQGLLADTRPEVIINCAAFGAYSSQIDPAHIYDVNFHGTRQLLAAAHAVGGVRAFIQMGSSSEYGIHCSAPREDGPTWPDSDYAVSKVAASALVRFYGVKYALPAFVMRLYSVYGPLEDASRLIPQLLLHARDGRLPPLTNAEISRDFIHIDDVCAAIDALCQRAPQLNNGDYYNIGTGVCTTLRDLVGVASSLFPIRDKPTWGSMPARHWDHGGWDGNPSYAKEALGWSSKITLAQGLQSTMTWMEAHQDMMAAAMAQSVLASR